MTYGFWECVGLFILALTSLAALKRYFEYQLKLKALEKMPLPDLPQIDDKVGVIEENKPKKVDFKEVKE